MKLVILAKSWAKSAGHERRRSHSSFSSANSLGAERARIKSDLEKRERVRESERLPHFAVRLQYNQGSTMFCVIW